MNDKIEEKAVILPPFKHVIMTIGELPTSYVETMTYYEMLVWFTNYLGKTVIPAINENGEAVIELQELFVKLQTYVNDYFDNLDVQEEINNKLDDMAESGQLTDIIAQYLGLAGMIAFNSVADMKLAENLVNGSKCTTLGYASPNDGGNATYTVRYVTNDDVVNDATIIALYDDLLVAELIEEPEMNVEVLGINKNSSSNYNRLSLFVDKGMTILFTKGEYTGNIVIDGNLNIKFIDSELDADSGVGANISNAENCEYILNVKNASNGVQINTSHDLKIKAICDTCSQHGIYVNDSDNIICDIDVKDCGSCGFLCNPLTKDCNNLYIKGIATNTGLTSNVSPAIYFASGDTYIIKNSTVECKCYNSGYGGIFPFGDNNTCVNCLVDTTGVVTPAGAAGIWVHDSKDIKIINCFLTKSKRHGISVNKAINTLIDNCVCYKNEMAGIYLVYDNNATGRYQQDNANYKCNISNCILYDNSTNSTGTYSAITFDGYRDVTITNCTAFDDQETQTQGRGISNISNEKLENIVIANCNFRNNKYGDIQIDWTKVKYANYQTSNGLMLGMNGKQALQVGGLAFGGGNEVTTMRYLDVNTATTADIASYVVNLVNRLKNMGIL